MVRHGPHALEGIDERLVNFEATKHMNPEGLKMLPDGDDWLMVQFSADTREEADTKARDLIQAIPDEVGSTWYDDPQHEQQLWTVREAGLGATAHVPSMPDTWEGWEDSAVRPDQLGAYLRELKELFEEFGYDGPSVHGHFGHGCVHTRIPFDLASADGVATMRGFVERAVDLVVRHGGSLSGEHGDGQVRGELLAKMFGPELMEAFERLKALFDPGNLMNPGKVVRPYRLDENLRLGADYRPWEPPTALPTRRTTDVSPRPPRGAWASASAARWRVG